MSTTTHSPLPFGGYKVTLFDHDQKSGYLTRAGGKPCPHIHVKEALEGWFIEERSDSRIPAALMYCYSRTIHFPSAEAAAAAGLAVCLNHDRLMEDYAVPKPLMDLIERYEDEARDLESMARKLAFTAACAQLRVNQFRRAAKLPEREWFKDDLVERLEKWTPQSPLKKAHGDAPFFSEHVLYDLLGKDDARTVLAMVNDAKRRIDPVGGAL